MLLGRAEAPFASADWLYQVKWDGVRNLALIDGGQVRHWSRNRRDRTALYPELADLAKLPGRVVLDGEIIVLREGKPSFARILERETGNRADPRKVQERPATFVVFDLLEWNGRELYGAPLTERLGLLEQVLPASPHWQAVQSFPGEQGPALWQGVLQMELEGVVAKRRSSLYKPGVRTPDWLKIKKKSRIQAKIVGWTSGGLLLAREEAGELRFIGRAGSGLTAELWARVKAGCRPGPCPFPQEPSLRDRFLGDPGPVTWTAPCLSVEVQFTEWTEAGRLRDPVVLRIGAAPIPPANQTNPTNVQRPVTPERQPVTIEGRTLVLTNLTKRLWPQDGITKAELIAHYTGVAPLLLPYLRDRPLVLTRYPNGIEEAGFYFKNAADLPDWIPTYRHGDLQYLLCQEAATLAYIANLGAIELHPWLSRFQTPGAPDWSVIDLDPSEGCTWDEVILLARLVKQILDSVGVVGLPKLSGATGIHIYCPCTPDHTYADTAAFAEAIGRILLKAHPSIVTLERMVGKRGRKIYIDYLQNRRGQTITSVYGVRPKPGAPVSTPVTWAEIESGQPPRFTIRTLGERLRQVGDLFAPLLTLQQDLRRPTLILR